MYDVAKFECEIENAKHKENYGNEDFLNYLIELRTLPIYHPLPANKTQVRYSSLLNCFYYHYYRDGQLRVSLYFANFCYFTSF